MADARKDINRWVCPNCNKPNLMGVGLCQCGKRKDTSRVIDPAGNPVDDPAYRVTMAAGVLPLLAFLTTAVIIVATLPVSATTVGATAVVAIGVMAVPGSSQAAEPPPVNNPQSDPGAGVTGMVPSDDGPSIQSNADPGAADPGTTTTNQGTSNTTTTTTTTTSTGSGHSGSDYDDSHDPDPHDDPEFDDG